MSMTKLEYIEKYPQKEHENQSEYARRLTKIALNNGQTFSTEAFRTKIVTYIKTQYRLDKYGNEVSSTHKLQSEAPEVPEGWKPTKITKTNTNQHWISYSEDKDVEIDTDLIKNVVKKVQITQLPPPKIIKTDKMLVATYTDLHIGMDTDKEGIAMYPSKWNKDEVMATIPKIVSKVDKNLKDHEAIHVRDLGDLLDGLDKKTTRGGHELHQNMTNTEAFECALEFKLQLAKELNKFGLPLYFHNVVNDNHSGGFAERLNIAVKEVLKYMIPSCEYYLQRKFIDHYKYGDKTFVLSHGKDKKQIFKPLKQALDKDTRDKIENYCKNFNLKGNIIVEKGDEHVYLHSMKYFYNFISHGATSPASEWVQTNFDKSKKMITIMEVPKKGKDVEIKPYEI